MMNEEAKKSTATDLYDTLKFKKTGEKQDAHEVLLRVYSAMREKGYDPVTQIVGYLISGDPTYITSYKNARYLVRMLERDELLEELVRSYIENYCVDVES